MPRDVEGLYARARKLARALRHTPDRLLHGIRRRRSMRRLEERPPRSILVICLGNICRSPFAAAALQQHLDGRGLDIESAGLLKEDRPSPELAQQAALRRGIDLSRHRSQTVTPALVDRADLVVVMDGAQQRLIRKQFGRRQGVLVLGDLDPASIDTRTVRDPFDQAEEVFDQVYERIERCVQTLTESMPNGRSGARQPGR